MRNENEERLMQRRYIARSIPPSPRMFHPVPLGITSIQGREYLITLTVLCSRIQSHLDNPTCRVLDTEHPLWTYVRLHILGNISHEHETRTFRSVPQG